VTRIAGHGLAVDPPRGWDAVIYRRPPEPLGLVGRAVGAAAETPMPILHLANLALPAERGDYGTNVATDMRAGGVFISLLQHDPRDVDAPLFGGRPVPWPLRVDDVRPEALHRRFPDGAGHQSFFVAAGRPYCLFLAIAGWSQRVRLVTEANRALASVTFT
jgi:hypothetical protein